LPEAQLDRFFVKLALGYLDEAGEEQMLQNLGRQHPIDSIGQVVDGEMLAPLARAVWDIHIDHTVRQYIVRLVLATRAAGDLALGASPRGTLALYRASQALAAVRGRDHVLPDDVKELAQPVLAHRCLLRPDSALRGQTVQQIIAGILESTPLDLQ
jgi:MoxR-like ATPase